MLWAVSFCVNCILGTISISDFRYSSNRGFSANKVIVQTQQCVRGVPSETRAGTARLSIQKDTQESTTINIVGKQVWSMKKKMCLLRMKLMQSLLYQPERKRRQSRPLLSPFGKGNMSIPKRKIQKKHTNSTGTAVESQATGRVKLFYKELRENDLIGSQRVVSALPVQHEVVFIISICVITHEVLLE